MRSNGGVLALVSLMLASTVAVTTEVRNHKKRQIYREEVLPHAGGKIPDTAFETDRLYLNQLQKDGISVPDGIVPESRNPQVYPFYSKPSRKVYRIALSSDARYTPYEGRYQHQEVPSVETTYLFPQIHGHQVEIKLPTPTPAYPVYKQLQLHNPLLNQVKLQPKKKAQFLNLTPMANSKSPLKSYKTETYQNFNIFNSPVAPSNIKSSAGPASATTGSKFYQSNYGSSHIFNEFDDLFNNFDLHETENDFYKKSGVYPAAHVSY